MCHKVEKGFGSHHEINLICLQIREIMYTTLTSPKTVSSSFREIRRYKSMPCTITSSPARTPRCKFDDHEAKGRDESQNREGIV